MRHFAERWIGELSDVTESVDPLEVAVHLPTVLPCSVAWVARRPVGPRHSATVRPPVLVADVTVVKTDPSETSKKDATKSVDDVSMATDASTAKTSTTKTFNYISRLHVIDI